ncbi:MAG TPA: YggT family protein [Acidimicrobiales bacterium]|nr:YggT family protein [Acidimicrobiales bacterium]
MFFNFRSGNPLFDIGELYVLILFARAIVSWFPYDPTSPLNGVRRVLYALTEPVLRPFRRLIPPIGMIDISFLVAIIVVQLVVTDVLGRLPI